MTNLVLRGVPSPEHEARRKVLDAVATLIGYRAKVPVPLSDGCVPDVIRASVADGAIFIGEAKDAERPSGAETRARLIKYATWVVGRPSAGRLPNVIAVCYGRRADTNGWVELLGILMANLGVTSRVRHVEIPGHLHVVFATSR